jgi:hypothetical protein
VRPAGGAGYRAVVNQGRLIRPTVTDVSVGRVEAGVEHAIWNHRKNGAPPDSSTVLGELLGMSQTAPPDQRVVRHRVLLCSAARQ